MIRQATYIYCDRNHPLAGSAGARLDVLLQQKWISPGYDDDTGPAPVARHPLDFAVRVDTMMNALLCCETRHSSWQHQAALWSPGWPSPNYSEGDSTSCYHFLAHRAMAALRAFKRTHGGFAW